MGRVGVEVGGRTYALSCGDGEEAHLAALGHVLAAKADELTAAIGTMSEPRLLLMAGLQVADELFAARAAGGATDATVATDGGAEKDGAAATGPGDDPQLAAILARVEALAAMLEE